MIEENTMNLVDYERQEELSRANQLFSESNNLQKKTIRSTTKCWILSKLK